MVKIGYKESIEICKSRKDYEDFANKKWVAVDDMIRELQRIQTCHDCAKDHNIKLLLGELKCASGTQKQ